MIRHQLAAIAGSRAIRAVVLLGAITGLGGAGCGDNAGECGDGTLLRDGLCVPASSLVCGEGTKLAGDRCVIDPGSCQADTVLIGGRCVDPTAGLTIDLDESAEPNGLGIATGIEASTAPAGIIVLPPSGRSLIVHGHLTPFRDADGDGQLDPDVDTYLMTIAVPTLLDITVDGVGGTLGAFYAVGDPVADPLYERYGVSATGDTAQRRLFLPAAGRYAIAIADTRSIAIGHNPPRPAGAGAAAGGPGAEYYASLTVQPIPAPSPIAIIGGVGTQSGSLSAGEVEFFTAQVAAGVNDIHDAMPGAAAASVAVLRAGLLVGYSDENQGPAPSQAEVTVAMQPGDMPLIVLDAVYNYGAAAEPFTLTIAVR